MAELNLIEKLPDGTLLIRFLKEDGGWHRTSIPPGCDIDTQLDYVDRHLKSMNDRSGVKLTNRTVVKAQRIKGIK